MLVQALYAYPVKACRALALEQAALGPLGIEHDRRFAFVDESGRAVTQRDQPLLATIAPALDKDTLRLDCGGLARVSLLFSEFSQQTVVDVWGQRIAARATRADVLSEYLGVRVALAMLEGASTRGFVDSKPVLVTTTGMLARLGLAGVGMERFRANVVLEGDGEWRALRGREAAVEYVEPCSRCEVTTIDQASGTRRGPEPLLTLNQRFGGNFGAYCRVSRAGRLARGEQLQVS